jgi:Uma2 family endonuclease
VTISLSEATSLLPLTAEDYAELSAPDDVRIELWNGNLDMSAAAQMGWHTEMAHRICGIFRETGRVTYRESGVVLAARTVRAPDVTCFRAGYQPDPFASQYPATEVDVVVEVVSPESERRDKVVKPLEYAQARIPEMWIVEQAPPAADDAMVNIFRLTPAAEGEVYTLTRRARLSEIEAEAEA